MLRRFGENTSIEVSCVTPPESVDATESSNPCEVQDGDWHLERLVGETSPSYSAGLEFELTGVAQSAELA
jgi:hypothetical protein